MSRRFLRPYFVWRPSQFIRAIRTKLVGRDNKPFDAKLPWGSLCSSMGHDFIAHRLAMHGILAIEACETTFRLLDSGEFGVDAGANVGVVTSAMAHRVGSTGRVVSFEMMPETYQYLARNVERWKIGCPNVEAINTPLSDSEGEINIGLSEDFTHNTGVAYATHGNVFEGHRQITMVSKTLDSFFPAPQFIHLLKLDVEQHEVQVFAGASELLKSGRIRDIIFEDAAHKWSPAKVDLTSKGYSLFALTSDLWGMKLTPVIGPESFTSGDSGEYTDFLATREPARAIERFKKSGYRCLRG